MELAQEMHDFCSIPSHKVFSKWDLKHGYWAIEISPECRHIFAFTAPGFGQLQPTRMQQGSASSSFSFNELMFIGLGYIPPLPLEFQSEGYDGSEPSLITSPIDGETAHCKFYIDDIVSAHKTFLEELEFIENHFLPRILWSMLKLSFEKLDLFCGEVLALGVTHAIGGISKIKTERAIKIKVFPVPKSQSQVRSFLATVGITRV